MWGTWGRAVIKGGQKGLLKAGENIRGPSAPLCLFSSNTGYSLHTSLIMVFGNWNVCLLAISVHRVFIKSSMSIFLCIYLATLLKYLATISINFGNNSQAMNNEKCKPPAQICIVQH